MLHISCPLLLKIEKFIHLGKLSRSDEIYSVENITTLLIEKKTSFKLRNTKLGAFHLRRLASDVAGKLGNAYLRYQIRQPATRFPLTATVAILAIPILPVKWKAPFVYIIV